MSPIKPFREYRARNHVILWLIALLIVALRIPNCWRGGEFVGEDAWVFFAEAFNKPWSASIFTPYAGYFHILPRILAELFSILPIDWRPYAYGVFSIGCNAFIFSLFYFPHFETLVRDSRIRAGVVILMALAGNAENLGLLLGLHWYVTFAMTMILVMDPPKGRFGQVALYALAFLTIWSTPTVVVLFPFLVFKCRYGSTRFIRRWALFATLNLITVGLFILWMRLDSGTRTGDFDFVQLLVAIERLVLRGWLGCGLLGKWLTLRILDTHVGILYLWVACCVVAILWMLWSQRKTSSAKRISLLIIVALLMILLSLSRSLYIAEMAVTELPKHVRYLTVPTLLLLIVTWSLLSQYASRKRWPVWVTLWALQAVLFVLSYSTFEHPSDWPGRGLPRVFHIRDYVTAIDTTEQKYHETNVPATLYIPCGVPYWGPVLKWGGGAEERLPPLPMAECLGLTADADGYCDSWLGRFRQFQDTTMIELGSFGILEFRGVSEGRVWFRDAEDQLIFTSPLLYPTFCVMDGLEATWAKAE